MFERFQALTGVAAVGGFIALIFIPFPADWQQHVAWGILLVAVGVFTYLGRRWTRDSRPRIAGTVVHIEDSVGYFRQSVCTVEINYGGEVLQLTYTYDPYDARVAVGQQVEVTIDREFPPFSEVTNLIIESEGEQWTSLVWLALLIAGYAAYCWWRG